MQISARTIKLLVKFILGECPGFEYKKGEEIVDFFNEFSDQKEIYEKDFSGSRSKYVESKLKRLNGSDSLIKIVEEAFDPTYCPLEVLNDQLSYFNQFLIKDGFIAEIVSGKHRKYIKVSSLRSELVNFPSETITSEFIKEQIDKCNSKIIRENDLDGAITNARSLVEAVLEDILKSLGHEIPKNDGNLINLYKHFRKHFNLDPIEEMDGCFKQIASGIITCITGLSGISNKISDRHSRTYKPLRYHAQLAVDLAFTICKFLLGVVENKQNRLPP